MNWPWVAVAVALLLGSGCSGSHSDGSIVPEFAPSRLAPPQPPPEADNACWVASSTTVPPDTFGTVHTIPPRADPVTYEVAVAPSTVCPGGTVRVAIRVDNGSSKTLTVTPDLILVGPPSEQLDCCDPITVPGHGRATLVETVTIAPSVSTGRKVLAFGDYLVGDPLGDGEAALDVVAPTTIGPMQPAGTTPAPSTVLTPQPTSAARASTTTTLSTAPSPSTSMPFCMTNPPPTTVPCRTR